MKKATDLDFQRLIDQGYFILRIAGIFVLTIKNVNGQDKYVSLKYDNGEWMVLF